MRGAVMRRALVAAYCIFIYYLSSRNDYPDLRGWYPAWAPAPSYVVHFILYSGLAFAAWIMFRRETWNGLMKWAKPASVLFAAIYGVTDEIHQAFVPGRQCDIRDWAVDASAADVM
ncbi:MAG TPA: VanZ family protein, partial [bacterium]|nr:VanZ family protein [bacterium]